VTVGHPVETGKRVPARTRRKGELDTPSVAPLRAEAPNAGRREDGGYRVSRDVDCGRGFRVLILRANPHAAPL
jgi:hypothetical protein